MKESLYFLSGVVMAVLTMHLIYIVWRKKIEKSIESIFEHGIKIIGEAQNTVNDLKSSALSFNKEAQSILNQLKSSTHSFNQEFASFSSSLDKLSSDTRAIPMISGKLAKDIENLNSSKQQLTSLMKHFDSFVQTVETIQEKGVQVIARDEKHPNLHSNIVLLFAKQTGFSGLIQRLTRILPGAKEDKTAFESKALEKLELIESRLARIEKGFEFRNT